MKNNYFVFITLIICLSVKAQIVNIPDANFKAKLLEADVTNEIAKDANDNKIKIDINSNGEIEANEALLVYKLFYTPGSGGPPPFKTGSSSTSSQFFANYNIADLTGIAAFTNLTYLNVTYGQLATLDLSNNIMLTTLYASGNLLTSINVSGLTHLAVLVVTNNDLNGLDSSDLTSLVNLDCRGNAIPSLDLSLSIHLKYLDCSENQLSELNLSACAELIELKCNGNQIGLLTVNAPATLKKIYCYSNQITSDFDLTNYAALEYFDCDTNEITTLSFGNNPNLVRVWCANNNIGSLDFSDTSLYRLSCGDNPNLTFLNVKNGVITPDLYVSQFPEPPFIEDCFKLLNTPALQYICHDEGEFGTTLVINEGLEEVGRGTYCSFQPGGSFNTISGTIALDCGGTNFPFFNQKLSVVSGTQTGITYSNTTGNYFFYTGTGAVTVSPQLENNSYFTVVPADYNYNFSTTGGTETANFCLTANGVHPDLEISILPIGPARPGFDAKYKIIYKNKGNQVQDGTVSLGFDDAVLDYISAIPAITSQTVNLLLWDFTGLAPFETRIIDVVLNVNSPQETPAVNINDQLSYAASIVSSQSDETPNDNLFNFIQTATGPFDPNDKAVLEGSQIDILQTGDYLHYMVRFQNTGNAAAENVVIKDVLDANLDWSTLQMVSGSHPFRSTLTNNNRLEVFFEGIDLPPSSTNEEGSHGYIAFKIKPKSTVVIYDVISNTAGIYFDYNFPIITNTVTTTVTALGTPAFSQHKLFTVYPNPASSQLNIVCVDNAAIKSITILNALGQIIMTSVDTIVNIGALSKGAYFITVVTDRGSETQKIIKF